LLAFLGLGAIGGGAVLIISPTGALLGMPLSILEKSKEDNKAVVEFTLPLNNEQIFSKEYKLYLPSKDDLKKQLE
jgi:hypothetical protein